MRWDLTPGGLGAEVPLSSGVAGRPEKAGELCVKGLAGAGQAPGMWGRQVPVGGGSPRGLVEGGAEKDEVAA